MSNRKTYIAAFVLLLAVTGLMAGEQRTVTVRVDGLACPFCAYGLEKKLKKIEGVEKLEIKINDGLALLRFKAEAKIDRELIANKVKEAGFTPKEINIQGEEIKTVKGQQITLNVSGMACEGCVARIEKTLSKMDCVHDVKVSLSDKKAEFTCTKEKTEPAKFVQTIEKLGFKAKVVDKE